MAQEWQLLPPGLGSHHRDPRPLRAATSKEGRSPSPVPAVLTQFSSREPLCGGTHARCHGPVTGSGVRSPSDPVVVVPCPQLSARLVWVGLAWGVPVDALVAPPVTQEGGEPSE